MLCRKTFSFPFDWEFIQIGVCLSNRRGRRLGAPYPLPLRGRWLLPEAKGGGREMKKSLPQSNALHLTAPSRRGRKRRAIRESPLQPVGNGLDRSVKLYQITRANTVRPYEPRTTEDAFCKITSKSTGGRGNPPLQRGAELRLRHYPFVATRHFP